MASSRVNFTFYTLSTAVATYASRWNGGTAPLILNFSSSGQFQALATLHREKLPGTQWIEGRVGPTASLDFKEEKDMLPLSGIKPWFLSHPACGLTTTSPTLSQLIAQCPDDRYPTRKEKFIFQNMCIIQMSGLHQYKEKLAKFFFFFYYCSFWCGHTWWRDKYSTSVHMFWSMLWTTATTAVPIHAFNCWRLFFLTWHPRFFA